MLEAVNRKLKKLSSWSIKIKIQVNLSRKSVPKNVTRKNVPVGGQDVY